MIFDRCHGRRTIIVLQEGLIEVCTTVARRKCKMLSRRGDVITVTGNALEGPRPGGPGKPHREPLPLGRETQLHRDGERRAGTGAVKTRLSAKPPG